MQCAKFPRPMEAPTALAASLRKYLLPLLMDFCRGTWHARLHGGGRARRSGRRKEKNALDAAKAIVPCAANKTLGSEVLQDAAKWVWHVAFCNAGQCAALRRSVLRGEVTVALERPRLLALPPRLREAVEGMAAAEESRVGSKRECWCVGSWCQWCDCERVGTSFLRNSSSFLQTPWSPQRSALGSLLPTLNPVQLCSRWPRTGSLTRDIDRGMRPSGGRV